MPQQTDIELFLAPFRSIEFRSIRKHTRELILPTFICKMYTIKNDFHASTS